MQILGSIRSARPETGVRLAIAGLLVSMTFGSAMAQQRLPGLIDRPPIKEPEELREEKAPSPAPAEPTLEVPAAPGEIVATLEKVTFDGTLILPEAQLQAVAQPFLNKPMTRADLVQLKYELTRLYYREGYVLVKVTTPPQDLSDGELLVNVYAGRIGELTVEGGDVVSDRVVRGYTAGVVQGEVFREQTVETSLQDLNDINNIEARMNLRPGKEVGTTDLRLILSEADQDRQRIGLDNHGSTLTGREQVTVDLEKTNLLNQGERFGFSGVKSDEDLETWQVDVSIPTGFRNVAFEANYLDSENDIGDYLAPLDASGDTKVYGFAVSSAIVNQQQQKGTLRLGIEAREHESFINDGDPESDDNITQVYLEGSYLRRRPKYVYFGSARLSKGVSWLGADDKGEADNTRIDGDPRAWIMQLTFFGKYKLTDADFIQLYSRAQYANETLLSSDLFSIGGYNNVRGFEPAQTVGERGLTASIEYYHEFPMYENWRFKAGPFLDAGWVGNEVDNSVVDSELYAVGLGAEASIATSNKMESRLRLDWGHKLGSYDGEGIDSNVFYARFEQTF